MLLSSSESPAIAAKEEDNGYDPELMTCAQDMTAGQGKRDAPCWLIMESRTQRVLLSGKVTDSGSLRSGRVQVMQTSGLEEQASSHGIA